MEKVVDVIAWGFAILLLLLLAGPLMGAVVIVLEFLLAIWSIFLGICMLVGGLALLAVVFIVPSLIVLEVLKKDFSG